MKAYRFFLHFPLLRGMMKRRKTTAWACEWRKYCRLAFSFPDMLSHSTLHRPLKRFFLSVSLSEFTTNTCKRRLLMAVARFFHRHAKLRKEKTRLEIWSSIYGLLTENIDAGHRWEALNITSMGIRTTSMVDTRTSPWWLH